MKKVFTVTEVKGSKRSTNNQYAAALIGVFDWDKYEPDKAKVMPWEESNFKYAKKNASASEGEILPGRNFEATAEIISEGKELIAKYPTLDLYLQGRADERVKKIRETRSKLVEGEYEVLAWASRFDLAEKRISEFSKGFYKGLKVVPTVQIK